MDKRSMDELLETLLYGSNLSNQLQNIRYNITVLKSGGDINTKNNLNDLEYYQNKYSLAANIYNKFRVNLESIKNEFDRLSKEYNAVALAFSKNYNCNSLRDEKVLREMYKEMVELREQRSKVADDIQKLITDNLGIAFELEERTFGFKENPLQNVIKEAGYQTGMSISSDLQKQTDDMLKQDMSLMGVDIEKIQKSDEITKIIADRQKSKLSNQEIINVQIIHPLEVGNFKIEQIFQDVYQRLETIQDLHKDNKLSINEEQYNYIISEFMKIVELYQDIQLIITNKEAFKNTSANKYNEELDKFIEKSFKEIEKTYANLNKYVAKLNRADILGPVIDKISDGINETVQSVKDVKDGVINGINKPVENKDKSNISKPSIGNKDDVITTLDNYRQKIFVIDQNKDLMQRKRLLEIEYVKFRDLKFGQANIPFVEFLKIYHPDEIELIKSEEVREQQIKYVYQLWQKSGRYMEFGKYASEIQGVNIKYPYDYTTDEDKVNYDASDKLGISYVETKNKNIDAARERYQKKSALWRAFHRKMNPERLNLNEMTNEQIEELYGGKRR